MAIQTLPTIYNEPFADFSQFPTCLVNQLARRHVTVALSGYGVDELFADYNRHVSEKRLREEGFFAPLPIRQMGQEHLSGKRRWYHHLWDVLIFQAWNKNRIKHSM